MKKAIAVILWIVALVVAGLGLMMLIGSLSEGFLPIALLISVLILGIAAALFVLGLKCFNSPAKPKPAPAPPRLPTVQETAPPPVPMGAGDVGDLKQALMALNDDELPFGITETDEEGADLVAEWKITDAKWRAVFGKAGMKYTFKMLMRFDLQKKVVRCVDKEYSVRWQAGVPVVSLSGSYQRGQLFSSQKEVTFGFKEGGGFGKVAEVDFSTGRIKKPIKKVISDCGWKAKWIAFGKL